MLYSNSSQGAMRVMGRDDVAHDVARDLRGEVWAEVHRAFAVRRQADGLTQAELARRMALPRERIHYWMSRPERMTLCAAARLMAGMNGRLECRGRLVSPGADKEMAE